MEAKKQKKSKLEYVVLFVLIFIGVIFASRIYHILQSSTKGCGGVCPVTGTAQQNGKAGGEQ
jgi:hypothetical protein